MGPGMGPNGHSKAEKLLQLVNIHKARVRNSLVNVVRGHKKRRRDIEPAQNGEGVGIIICVTIVECNGYLAPGFPAPARNCCNQFRQAHKAKITLQQRLKLFLQLRGGKRQPPIVRPVTNASRLPGGRNVMVDENHPAFNGSTG